MFLTWYSLLGMATLYIWFRGENWRGIRMLYLMGRVRERRAGVCDVYYSSPIPCPVRLHSDYTGRRLVDECRKRLGRSGKVSVERYARH